MNIQDHPVDSQEYQQDKLARQAAIDISNSVFVVAPAGAGKTELLCQRFLSLLANVQSPDEILAITFTNKAADEMRQRIMNALKNAQQPPPPEDSYQFTTWQIAKRALDQSEIKGWQLLKQPAQLQIYTIDSFCNHLIRRMPVTSNSLGIKSIITPIKPLYQKVVHSHIHEWLKGNASSNNLDMLAVYMHNNIPKIEEYLIQLLTTRDQWLPLIGSGVGDEHLDVLRTSLQKQITLLIESHCQKLMAHCDKIAHAGGDELIDLVQNALDVSSGDKLSEQDNWKYCAEGLLTKAGKWRSRGSREIPASAPIVDELSGSNPKLDKILDAFRLDLHRCRILPNSNYSDEEWQALVALMNELPLLVARLEDNFQQQQGCDYIYIQHAALTGLGDDANPTDLGLFLHSRLNHILLDEFQDTSRVQYRMLSSLVRDWEVTATGKIEGRSLFVVGDGMQSCYLFRNARVGLFLKASRDGVAKLSFDTRHLLLNFRSQKAIVDWVNRVFSQSFPDKPDINLGAVPFTPSTAFRPPLEEQAVSLHGFEGEYSQQAQAWKIAELIHQTHQLAPEDSIAILVRKRSQLRELLPVLRQAGLSWQANDIDALKDRPIVRDLFHLTKAMLQPQELTSWLALLRSPWCGLTNSDLLAVTDGNVSSSFMPKLLSNVSAIKGLSSTGVTNLTRVAKVLLQGLAQKGKLPLRTWIEGIWLALGGPACCNMAVELDEAYEFFCQLDIFADKQWSPPIETLEHQLQAIYASADINASSWLQVMTIHKAKGLEFDRVIIPNLDQKSSVTDNELLAWREYFHDDDHESLVLAPIPVPHATDAKHSLLYEWLREEQKFAQQHELMRLLYIGATRAIKQLHLLFKCQVDKKEGGYRAPLSNSLLKMIWPVVKGNFEVISCDDLDFCHSIADSLDVPLNNQKIDNSNVLWRLPNTWKVPLFPPPITSSLDPDDRASELNQDKPLTTFSHQIDSRSIGSVAHQVLEQIGKEGLKHWDAQRIEKSLPLWQVRLRQQGLTSTTPEEAANRVKAVVSATLGDKKGRWLLSDSHDKSHWEYELTYHDVSLGVRHLVIDLCFITDGLCWVVDYKTASPSDGEGLETFLQRQEQLYRGQLNIYRKAVEKIYTIPIKTALYFPLIPHFHQVNPEI